MAKSNKITIDFDIWTTQANKARLDSKSYSYIRQKVTRSQQGKTNEPIEYWTIPELGITLVKK
jgi:hypothetical protein